MDKEEFKTFFAPYSTNVDNARSLAFWRLSDDLVMTAIKKYIPVDLPPDSVILDAGGGTGRWICDLGKVYGCTFVLFDLSEDMLSVAARNILNAGMVKRVKVVQGDLTEMKDIPSGSVNYIVSIYSPISFVSDKETAVKEMYRVLKKGGKILIMGHGYYNALASKINNYNTSVDELGCAEKESMVKWGAGIPKLNLFSKESMEGLLKHCGFTPIATHGIPVFVQPGPEDWDANNELKSRISIALHEEAFYKRVFELETKYSDLPTVANRGMNIFSIAEK
jgi:ubiquinone/menaquinone biosynthesis C-methylase UbiE